MNANYIDIDTVKDFLREHYSRGETVQLEFVKRNGALRKMTIQEDQELLATIRGERKVSNETNRVVCEKLEDGSSQFRSIPLDRVLTLATL